MKRNAVLFLLCVSVAVVSSGAERFGDFTKHRLKIRIDMPESGDRSSRALEIKLPAFLVLANGHVDLTKNVDAVPDKYDTQNRIEIFHRYGFDGKKVVSIPGEPSIVRFYIVTSTWNADDFEIIVTIPYTVDDADEKRMIQFSEECTVEMYDRDPKGRVATLYLNPMGWPFVVKGTAKCTVLESTLGFANILK